jgi:hypothetical protein
LPPGDVLDHWDEFVNDVLSTYMGYLELPHLTRTAID